MAILENESLNAEMACIMIDQEYPKNKKSNKSKKKQNKFLIILKQFQMIAIQLDGAKMLAHGSAVKV